MTELKRGDLVTIRLHKVTRRAIVQGFDLPGVRPGVDLVLDNGTRCYAAYDEVTPVSPTPEETKP